MLHYKNILTALLLSTFLGISHGHLAIYISSTSDPVRVLPYDISLFTPADQKALANGIPFSNDVELNKLLEDFTS